MSGPRPQEFVDAAASSTIHRGRLSRSQSATTAGTFSSSRTRKGSDTPDDLLLVDHLAGVFEGGDDIFSGQLRVCLDNPF